jgi:hypothetical protein
MKSELELESRPNRVMNEGDAEGLLAPLNDDHVHVLRMAW